MPKLKLTKTNVEALRYDDAVGQVSYWDTETPGFLLLLNKTCKTFHASGYANGKPVLTKIGRYGIWTAEQARLRAKELLLDMAKGINPNEQKRAKKVQAEADAKREQLEKVQAVTLRQALEKYLEERRLKPNTVHDYKYDMAKSFADWLDRPVQSITEDEVAERYTQIQKRAAVSPKNKHKNPRRGEAQANGAMRVLRLVINYAVIRFKLPKGPNPVTVLSDRRMWFKDVRRQRVIPHAYLGAWIRAVQALPDMVASNDESGAQVRWNSAYAKLQRIRAEQVRDFLTLLLFTGLRRTEAASLTWDAIDLKAKTLRVTDTKNSDTLVLPLPDYITDMLRKREEQHAEIVKQVFAMTHPNNLSHFQHRVRLERFKPLGSYVFLWLPAPHRPISPKSLCAGERELTKTEWRYERVPYLNTIHDYLEQVTAHIAEHEGAAVPFSPHDLRRTFATVAESLDLSTITIKALLNHRRDNSDVTAGYTILSVERLRKAMTAIEREIRSAAGLLPTAQVISLDAARAAG